MKKNNLLFVLLIVTSLGYSQQEKSLLWKISGNGLKKDSYLFGTMHVSQKIAFHLDDIFYESLQKADFVALESDPTLWLDYAFNSREMSLAMNMGSQMGSSNFYNIPFELKAPKKEEIGFFLSQENTMLNAILYRTNQGMQDFQEDTYLDMFIYQGGSKFGKKIYSLEDVEKSKDMVDRASINPMKDKPDVWLQKRLKDDYYLNLIQRSYRERNIALLDSINKGMYTKNHMKYMLYLRNEEMAANMDTIMQKGSLFAGIGAAHLPGEEGVLNMLKEKGYTVSPLLSEETKKGVEIKEQIEQKFVDRIYAPQTSSDGFFTVDLPNKLYELNIMNNTVYLSPDLTNGAYVIISRISTFDYFESEKHSVDDIDKLLFENIPGKIVSKKRITNKGLPGINVVNITKTGNYQRYQIFVSPLEILIFKMGGKKEFVKNKGQQLFESITFNNLGSQMVTVSPKFGQFEVEVPQFHLFTNKKNIGQRLIQAVDKNDNYYFVKEVVLNDVSYLEEDDFELERIHERFYKNSDMSYSGGKFENRLYRSFISHAPLEHDQQKILHLKTVTVGGHYYLLGCISNNDKIPTSFFDSFKLKKSNPGLEAYKIRKDTSLYFSVNTNIRPPKIRANYNYKKKRNKEYLSKSKKTSYHSDSNESIYVSFIKYHDYSSFENVDSLWNHLIRKNTASSPYNSYNLDIIGLNDFQLNRLSLKPKFIISNKKTGKNDQGLEELTYLLKDSLSSKAIRVKHLLKNGVTYELKTLIDTTYQQSMFIEEFYTSFKAHDTLIGKSLFADKTADFFKALKAKDSLVFDSYQRVKFKEGNAGELLNLISNFDFDKNQLEVRTHLIKELGKLKNKAIKPFLRNLYRNSYDNPQSQIAIFKSFAKDRTQNSYKELLDLLEQDIPLSSNEHDITFMIYHFRDSIQLTEKLFPEMLNYTTIREYKEPIYQILTEAIDSNVVNPKRYRSHLKRLLTEAKIELKRQLGKKVKENSFSTYNYRNSNYSKDGLLNIYTKLLFPFRNEKSVADFYTKLATTDDYYAKITHLALKLKSDEKVQSKKLNELAKDLKSRATLYKTLKKIDRVNLFPKEFNTQQLIAESLLFSNRHDFEKSKDSLVFIEKRAFKISQKEYEMFFYKTKKNNTTDRYDKDWKLHYITFRKPDDGHLKIELFHSENNEKIDETKELSEIIDDAVEATKLKDRERVNLEEQSNFFNGF